ncbi:hypothetical protein [Methylotuvimicrobium sp.]|uniref:hypothetical protein n=1 Tax=Methylotuvimicrobium sp. TaxID=2822413 RepID=UPI003D65B508
MMTINKDIEAKILRYHFVEQWRVGTIASQLGIHHSVVDRVLSQAGLPKVEKSGSGLKKSGRVENRILLSVDMAYLFPLLSPGGASLALS